MNSSLNELNDDFSDFCQNIGSNAPANAREYVTVIVKWTKSRGPAADAEYSTGVTDIGRRETGGKRGGKIKKE